MGNNKRSKIPETVKLKLWVMAAGRCEFNGCNLPVWRNNLTLSDGNFGEVAHIIGSSKSGPRGTNESEELQIEFSNLLLLCQKCHKEIDDNPKKYPIKLLRQWKREHEDRIEIQTSHPEDIHKSTFLSCSINIGERLVPINYEAVRNAMFPKYPVNEKGIKIEEDDFDRFYSESDWQSFANRKIKKKVEKCLEEGTDEIKINHLSIFAIGPIPLLIFLGKCIGDTIPCDIYQSHRNIENTSKTWNWKETIAYDKSFLTSCIKKVDGDTILLKIAISDTINQDKYVNLLSDNVSVYEITVKEPSMHFVKSKRQLECFSYEYRKLLNIIQAEHGKNCKIILLPAIPVSCAIECGRVILPTKDPNIYVCEYYKEEGLFKQVIKVN